ncbi:MAG: iron complex outermembrane receptor protein [Marivirga sp.]
MPMSNNQRNCSFLVALILVLGQCTLLAQNPCTVEFKGQVFEKGSHKPVSFASLYFDELRKGVQSNERGEFSLQLPCNMWLNIIASQFDYQQDTIKLFTDASNSSLEIYLSTKNLELSTITVHGHQPELLLKSNVTTLLAARELREQAGKSLSETLGSIAGVYNIKTGPGINKPMIHGLYGSRIQVVNNEVAQMGQQWGADHAPEIDPFLASVITVVKGAGSVKYGPRAIGGVILVNPEPLVYDSIMHGGFDVVGMSNGKGGAVSFQLMGGFNQKHQESSINWKVQSSLKKRGDQNTPSYVLSNTGVEEFNYSIAANYINKAYQLDAFYSSFQTEIGILRGAHVGNEDDLFAAINQRPPFFTEAFTYQIQNPRQYVKHHLLKAKLHFDWQGVGEFNTIYAFQQNNRQEYDIRRNSTDARPNIDLQLNSHIVKSTMTHNKLWDLLQGELGIDLEYQNNQSIPGTGSIPLIPNYESIQSGIFLTEAFKYDKFTFETGLRYDYQFLDVLKYNAENELINPQYNFGLYALIIGSTLQLNSHLALKANLSRSERAPNVNELFSQGLHHSLASIEIGDENLQKEVNNKFILSGSYSKDERLYISTDFHTSLYNGFIFLQPSGSRQTIRGAFPVYTYQQTDAILTGVDVAVSYEFFHHLVNKAQLSIVRGVEVESSNPLIFMPSDRFRNTLNWRINRRSFLSELDLKASINKIFKQNNAPATERFPFPDRGEIAVPEGYTTVDFSVSGSKIYNNSQLTVGISVLNVLNQEYTDYLNRLRYYAAEAGRNFELKLNYIF